ncbi:hypothetical protein [Persephonella sp.]
MDKKKLITKIIFGKENLDDVNFPVDETIKDNFEIAYDIAENFENIKIFMRKKTVYFIKKEAEKLAKAYPEFNLKVQDGFLKGNKWSPLMIYSNKWIRDKAPIISYAIDFGKNKFLEPYFGILKYNHNIPYEGKIQNHKESSLRTLVDIFNKYKNNGFATSEAWLIWRYLNEDPIGGMWKRNFYENIVENGYEYLANYMVEKLKDLIIETKEDIGKFVEFYKNSYRG